jgi:hypothetical protein
MQHATASCSYFHRAADPCPGLRSQHIDKHNTRSKLTMQHAALPNKYVHRTFSQHNLTHSITLTPKPLGSNNLA